MKYHTKAISTFHQINAFEEDGFLMLDLCCADDGQAINNYLIQNLRKSGEALTEVKESLTQGFRKPQALPAERCKMQVCDIPSLRLCYSGVRQPVQALPTPLRPPSPRQRRNANGSEPEHSALQPGDLRESRQRQGESECVQQFHGFLPSSSEHLR